MSVRSEGAKSRGSRGGGVAGGGGVNARHEADMKAIMSSGLDFIGSTVMIMIKVHLLKNKQEI